MKGAGRVTDDTGRGPAAERAGTTEAFLDAVAPRRGLRRFVGATVLVEGVALLAVAAFLIVEMFRRAPTDTGGAVAQAVFAVAIGLGLLQLGRVVLRADERARIPVLVWQLLQVSVGIPALSTNRIVAAVLLSTAFAAGVGVLVPGVLRPDVRGLARSPRGRR